MRATSNRDTDDFEHKFNEAAKVLISTVRSAERAKNQRCREMTACVTVELSSGNFEEWEIVVRRQSAPLVPTSPN